MHAIVRFCYFVLILWSIKAAAFSPCTGKSWDPDICNLAKGGKHCVKDQAATIVGMNVCKKSACPRSFGHKCHGFLDSGYWYPISMQGQAMRCQCYNPLVSCGIREGIRRFAGDVWMKKERRSCGINIYSCNCNYKGRFSCTIQAGYPHIQPCKPQR